MQIIDESDVPKLLAQKIQPLIFQDTPKCVAELYETCQERIKKKQTND